MSSEHQHRHQEDIIFELKRSSTIKSRALSTVLVAILTCAPLRVASLADHQANPTGKDVLWTLSEDSWSYWWSYSGVSGPTNWGLLNPDWFLCDKGRRQSPVSIETGALVYDPYLSPLQIPDNNLISGILYNDGHSIVFNGSAAAVSIAAKLLRGHANETANSGDPMGAGDKPTTNSSTSGKSVARRSAQLVEQMNSLDGFIMDEQELIEPKAQMLVRSDELSNELSLSVDRPHRFGDISFSLGDAVKSGLPLEASQATAADEETADLGDEPVQSVRFSGAGLAYSYRFEIAQLRFGQESTVAGSEHQIDKRSFAAELQLLSYNHQLYKNFHEASMRPHGLLGIAILIDTLPQSDNSPTKLNDQLERLLTHSASGSLKYLGQYLPLSELNLTALLPETGQFVTYEGSLTQPGCQESVTWLLPNRPLYTTKQILDKLRSITADEQFAPNPSGTRLAGNLRPVQALNGRPLRTNIEPPLKEAAKNQGPSTCARLWTRYQYIQSNT